jgi:L-serine deaminase
MDWKKMISKACATVSAVNNRYEALCVRAEQRLTSGSTIDAKLDKAVDVVVPAVKGAVSKVTPIVKDYGVRAAKATCTVIDNLPATTVVGAVRQGCGYVVMLSERATTTVKNMLPDTTITY